jgi:hypothetical protein
MRTDTCCSDFPKALWACTIAEIVTFSIVGSVIYVYTGNQYMVTPAFGVLNDVYKKASYSFMIPTIIFVGCLYASVSGRFVFFRMFKDSKHLTEHTIKGWLYWGLVLLVSWAASFIIAEVIPFFSSCKLAFSRVQRACNRKSVADSQQYCPSCRRCLTAGLASFSGALPTSACEAPTGKLADGDSLFSIISRLPSTWSSC